MTILFIVSITDTDNGTDVTLTLNCTTNNPTVSYQVDEKRLPNFFGYGWVTVEYTCTNSSSSIVSYVYNWYASALP